MKPKWSALLGAALLAVVALIAGLLVLGPKTVAAGSAAAEPSAAPVEEAAELAATTDERPNMVLILMDDFSLELLAHDAGGERMAAEGATYRELLRHRLALLPLARGAAHRADPAPHRRADQHPERPGAPDRRLRGVPALRQPERAVQHRAPGQRLHDRVRREVHQRATRPQASTASVPAAEGARLATGTRSSVAATTAGATRAPTSTTTAQVQLRNHPRPPLRRPGRQERPGTPPTSPRLGPRLHPGAPRRRGAVLPRDRDVRAALPARPRLPGPAAVPARRSPTGRPPATRPAATAARVRAATSRWRTWSGTATSARTTRPPTSAATATYVAPAPAWRTNEVSLTDAARAEPATATAPGWCSRSTG